MHQIHVYLPEAKAAQYTKYHLSGAERRTIIEDVGDSGLLYYEFLLRQAQIPNKEITLNDVVEYFGWSYDKAKRIRRKVVAAGYFDQASYKIRANVRGTTYYVGKAAVTEFRRAQAAEAEG